MPTFDLYDRNGAPIADVFAWAVLFEDPSYKIVQQTRLRNGNLVSTIWLGHDHRHGAGPPLIFETMVFAAGGDSVAQCRYSTEAESVAGHAEMVKAWRLRPNRRMKMRVVKKKDSQGRRAMRKTARKALRIAARAGSRLS